MTDDLVRDLRAMGYIACVKAAAEIERLRRTIAYMADHADAPAIIRREAHRVLENKP